MRRRVWRSPKPPALVTTTRARPAALQGRGPTERRAPLRRTARRGECPAAAGRRRPVSPPTSSSARGAHRRRTSVRARPGRRGLPLPSPPAQRMAVRRTPRAGVRTERGPGRRPAPWRTARRHPRRSAGPVRRRRRASAGRTPRRRGPHSGAPPAGERRRRPPPARGTGCGAIHRPAPAAPDARAPRCLRDRLLRCAARHRARRRRSASGRAAGRRNPPTPACGHRERHHPPPPQVHSDHGRRRRRPRPGRPLRAPARRPGGGPGARAGARRGTPAIGGARCRLPPSPRQRRTRRESRRGTGWTWPARRPPAVRPRARCAPVPAAPECTRSHRGPAASCRGRQLGADVAAHRRVDLLEPHRPARGGQFAATWHARARTPRPAATPRDWGVDHRQHRRALGLRATGRSVRRAIAARGRRLHAARPRLTAAGHGV